MPKITIDVQRVSYFNYNFLYTGVFRAIVELGREKVDAIEYIELKDNKDDRMPFGIIILLRIQIPEITCHEFNVPLLNLDTCDSDKLSDAIVEGFNDAISRETTRLEQGVKKLKTMRGAQNH